MPAEQGALPGVEPLTIIPAARRQKVDEEAEDGVSLEEILIAMVDVQQEILEAVSTGKPVANSDALKDQLQDVRDLLMSALVDPGES
jgi:hypothetical protein